ncbi:TPA: endolytic transglycosylase MltG [Streptococcus suis]|uniref:Endolytic murein transglycosylase n=1 Tax=Streptococcus suis TaxID=1307 RepID=A0A0Z8TQU5_STRSU|nr:endolytic transglycosylase MltG [Streptococcus suis]AXI65066.1 endolytic transglycosylase MltG [Streptococcus suis]MBO8112286.1 endolytic transglycosylase MltG [Streptococcus suis]MBS8091148.1 endolytic transglycosylase MltG [Streptococcus suis]MCB2950138.1 endolytic transglycosylase MltG [Streptococcus suis]MCH1657667.1 endolytic transglycosylase MltG [Streptococcus suis]
MTKDTNEKNTQSSGFRDQILRDLEELKVKRLAEQSADVLVDKRNNEVINELQPSLAEEKAPHRETEIVKVEGIAFPDSYLSEEQQESEVMTESIEEPTSETLATPETFVIEKEVVSSPVPQDTVERNLEKLRNLVAANTAGFDEVPSSSSVSEPVESVLPGNSPLEDTFLEFPTEDVSAVTGDTEIISLEETIIAPKTTAIVPEVDKQMQETQPRRRTTHRTSKQRRKKQDNAAKHIVSVIMSIVVVAVLVTGVTGYMWVKSSLEPVDAKATETIQVEIPEGTSTLEIGKILVDNKLIKNATIFNYYSKIKSYNNFQSGFYNLKQNMSVDDIAKALQESGTPTAQKEAAGKVLIVEGYTLTQIAQAITDNTNTKDKNDKTPFTAEQFMATVTNQDFINRMVATYPKLFASLPAADSGVIYQLEGYLFPAVYEYSDETTIEELVEQMIAAMDNRLQPYYETITAKNLTVNEVLTLASLVEKEGSTDEDRRNIASVFFNRLNAAMPLQSNIAILYAQGKLGQETTLAEDAAIDTSIESPYNIYWTPGLMPGPVDSPSLSAIEAVINANTTDYLYFVADVTTGNVYFTNNIDEHNQNVAKYVNAHLNNE